jgi:hypothetical protein
MFVQLLDASSKVLGLVAMLDTPSYSRSPAGERFQHLKYLKISTHH